MTSNNNNLISILLNRNVISINQNDTVYDAINILSEKKNWSVTSAKWSK